VTNEFERAAAAQASAPDPAWIASIANSLFRGVRVDAPPGPGASLPSAPAFAHEPVIASVPGAPGAAPPALRLLSANMAAPSWTASQPPEHRLKPRVKLKKYRFLVRRYRRSFERVVAILPPIRGVISHRP